LPPIWKGLAAGLIALLATSAVPAHAAESFAGKSIDLLIGAPPGGGYDIYARALARHYGRHIPGQPVIVAKNMPGAAGARVAGFISTLAPKDGTAIAAIMPGAVMGPLLDEKAEALFDATKVLYLGTANNGTRICVSRKDSKIKTFADALRTKAVFGGVSTNDSTRSYGYMHRNAARSTACAGGTWRASSRSAQIGCATTTRICCCRLASSPIPSSPAWACPRCLIS